MRNQMVAFAAAAFLAACASAPQQPAPNMASASTPAATPSSIYGMEAPYPVGSIPSATLHDAQRNKDLTFSIEYPTRGGPYPVIVFSHGFGSSSEGYIALTEFWAGHGYVVIKPSHADAGALRKILSERRAKRREEFAAAVKAGTLKRRDAEKKTAEAAFNEDIGESLWGAQSPADWENRVKDIELIVDSLGTLQQKYPELQGKMETAKVGMAGHSYGAFTTMLVAGATTAKTKNLGDPRIKAAIAMSPQGVGDQYTLTKDSWANVKTPILYMTGSLDRGIVNHDDPSWRHDPFLYSPAGDKYFISFEGARHITFTGGLGAFDIEDMQTTSASYIPMETRDIYGNPMIVQQRVGGGADTREKEYLRERNIFSAVKSASLAFWDAYLKDAPKAKEFVKGESLQNLNSGHVTVERK